MYGWKGGTLLVCLFDTFFSGALRFCVVRGVCVCVVEGVAGVRQYTKIGNDSC